MRKTLLTALAAAVLVVLLASAQGTAALLRAESQLTPGTISTGTLALQAGNGVTSAKDFSFAELNTAALVPGGYVQKPLTLSNTGNTKLNYSLAGALSTIASPTTADTALSQAVLLSIHAAAAPADVAACLAGTPSTGTALFQGNLSPAASFTPRLLAALGQPNSAQTLCIRLSLPSNANQSAAGGNLKLVLTWRGDQA